VFIVPFVFIVTGRRVATSAVIACAAALLAGSALSCSSGARETPRFLSIATGGTGGVYYPYGGGLAKILNENLPGVRATAEVTAASVDNLKLIRDGRADIAFTLADTLADAVAGRGAFEGRPVPAVSLAVLYSNYTQIVTTANTGIATIPDLRGRTVSTGSPGSGTEIIAIRLLRAAGLDPDRDLRRQALSVNASVDAIKDDKIDAFFWSGGLPTSQITDLVNSTKIVFVEHTDAIKKMSDKYGPFYFNATIPKNTYKNDSDVAVAGVANLLVAPSSLDPALAKAILATMFDNKSTLETVHAEAKNLKLETATKGSPLDFHPGAIDFYKSRDAWKP
jgi:TRAP transporter TAXI family solute receptor